MKAIELTRGKIVLISDEDYDLVNKYKWYAHNSNGKWYAKRKAWLADKSINKVVGHNRKKGEKRVVHGTYKLVSMHRYILNPPPNMEIDHIDGNTLNNQRDNLRVVDKFTNMFNQKLRADNSTGFRGVSYEKMPSGRWVWRAIVWANGKRYECGRHNDINDAIKARQDKVKYLQDSGVIPKVGRT